MSAYFCSAATFHLIATYAATVSTANDLKTVWRQLIAENLRSLNYRYPYDQAENVKTAAAELAAISDRPMLPLPAPGIIKSAIQQYDYQACEHDGYSSSPAGVLVAQLLASIDAPRADHPAGWYPVEDLPQARQPQAPDPEPVPVAAMIPPPTPAPDPIDAARQKLAAMFAMPSAPDADPCIDQDAESDALAALPPVTRRMALVLLLTLARVSSGHPDAARFSELAGIVGGSLTTDGRADASKQASAYAAALRAVLDTMDGAA